jgi:glycerophosphoryl diester phosphodiesterase
MPARFFEKRDRPLVIGHRGASATHPENTLRAFREAMAAGADGVELDVMRCRSGELVVVHDDDLGRVTGGKPGSGVQVRSATLDELRQYDVGGGERVPTLEEVIEALGPEALINIELKSRDVKTAEEHAQLLRDDGLAAAVAELLHRAPRPAGTTLVSSFDPFQLRRFARLAPPHIPRGFLFHRQQARPLREAWIERMLPVVALHPDAGLVDAASMRSWRRRGHAVHTWTVDDPREVAALCTLGVDAIITNRPGAVVAQLASP